jgi:sensor domain CHASE-containing protein
VVIGTLDSGSTILEDTHAYFVFYVDAIGVTFYNPWGGTTAMVTVPLEDLNENLKCLYVGEEPSC